MVNLAEEKTGVLLYYYYIDLRSSQEQTAKWLEDTCSKLGLVGRCRCAEDGLNCCLSGRISALLQHQEQLCQNFPGAREIVDFKLAEYPPLQTQDNNNNHNRVAKETGFDRLSVQICKEVVAFYGSRWEQVLLSNEAEIQPRGARHVEPIEFHNLLSQQQQQQQQHIHAGTDTQDNPNNNNNAAVLLDMRNKYETRIGTFQIPNIDTIDPETRSFNEVPTWLESHKHQLVGKTVFMVCTGGVRCERASAHLLKIFSNDPKEEQPVDVVQLRGGIQRYLEAFPEVDGGGGGGGYFRGKNFYFDDRISVVGGGGTRGDDNSVIGRCMGCRAPYDDYRQRHRCVLCRMLILRCTKCADDPEKKDMLCELCVERGKGGVVGEGGGEGRGEGGMRHTIDDADDDNAAAAAAAAADDDDDATITTNIAAPTTAMPTGSGNSKLKILVLHGFRQTGIGFLARNKDWMRKLSDIAEFTVIDAPHVLSYYYRKPSGEERKQQTYKRAWLVVPTDNNCSTIDGTTANNGSSGEEETNTRTSNTTPTPTPTTTSALSILPTPAPSYICNTQHLRQTEGWALSHRVIQEAMSAGTTTYDGILGFSQGSGIAAAMCALHPDAFKFCICASGYMPSVDELQKVLAEKKPICMPSMHVYGSNSNNIISSSDGTEKKQDTSSSNTKLGGDDADGPAFITSEDSHLLASMFDARQRCVLIHKGGHYIPGTRSVWQGMRKFLRGQQQQQL